MHINILKKKQKKKTSHSDETKINKEQKIYSKINLLIKIHETSSITLKLVQYFKLYLHRN